jgi:hypothetical protein
MLVGGKNSFLYHDGACPHLAAWNGIAVAIASAVIIILDRTRINKMKQFGDTSDLI